MKLPKIATDSGVFNFFGLLGRLIQLNLCFCLCCLPVVTAGPALCALYTVVLHLAAGEEKPVLPDFWTAFHANFRQGFFPGLAVLLIAAVLAMELNVISLEELGIPVVLQALTWAAAVVCLFLFSYLFPLLARFENRFGQTLKNAWLMSCRHLPRTLPLALCDVLPILLAWLSPLLFLGTGIVWILFGFALLAYGKARLLLPIFQIYMTQSGQTGAAKGE